MGKNKNAKYKEENEAFLQIKAESGEYEILKGGMLMRYIERGEGDRCPGLSDIVFCHYKGSLIDGSVFDSTEGEPYPAYFRVRELIEGWQIALVRMHAGDKCEIILPAKMGYGSSRVDGIPGNSTLIFELELVKIS